MAVLGLYSLLYPIFVLGLLYYVHRKYKRNRDIEESIKLLVIPLLLLLPLFYVLAKIQVIHNRYEAQQMAYLSPQPNPAITFVHPVSLYVETRRN